MSHNLRIRSRSALNIRLICTVVFSLGLFATPMLGEGIRTSASRTIRADATRMAAVVTPPMWKVYTHVYIAMMVRADALDGLVTIGDAEYEVDDRIVDALRDFPEYYYAGVVGPDGFPEVIFGQSIIHPENTGAWIARIYRSAWIAQTDPSYTDVERSQILAFAYGYLTHPAGDMWAHSLINDFAQGVFPAVADLADDVDARSIVLRHQIAEGYVRTATPGFDANPERGPAPTGYPNGAFNPSATGGSDVSDKNTPGIYMEAPHRFLYRTLVSPDAATPTTDRGALVDEFLTLRGVLLDLRSDYPAASVATLLNTYDSAQAEVFKVRANFDGVLAKTKTVRGSLTTFGSACDPLQNVGLANPLGPEAEACANATATLTGSLAALGLETLFSAQVAVGTIASDLETALAQAEEIAEGALINAEAVVRVAYTGLTSAYMDGWVANIDRGLENWSRLGLGISRGFFDAQTFRDAQNETCQPHGGEGTQARINCEDAISTTDAILFATESFVEEYFIPMIGEPEGVIGLRTALFDFADVVDSAMVVAGLPFNPVRETKAQLRERGKEMIRAGIWRTFGLDADQLEAFATSPSNWMAVEQKRVFLPGLGAQVVRFFNRGDHERLDAIMGLPTDHHVPPSRSVPNTRIAAAASFDPDGFAPLRNTRLMSALLLLDAEGLNAVAGVRAYFDKVVDEVSIPANIMVDGLDGEPWLLNIDSDHSWRENRLPRFRGTPPPELQAGSGQFPFWESCQIRPVFRSLFHDWEVERSGRSTANFPDWGDPCSETAFLTNGLTAVVTTQIPRREDSPAQAPRTDRRGDLGTDRKGDRKPAQSRDQRIDRRTDRRTDQRTGRGRDTSSNPATEATTTIPTPTVASTSPSRDLSVELVGPKSVRPGQALDRGFRLSVQTTRGPSSLLGPGYVVEIFLVAAAPRRGQIPDSSTRIPVIRVEEPASTSAGGRASLTMSGSLPRSLPEGRTYLCALVDPDGRVPETDEGNNLSCVELTVVSRRQGPPQPMIRLSSIFR